MPILCRSTTEDTPMNTQANTVPKQLVAIVFAPDGTPLTAIQRQPLPNFVMLPGGHKLRVRSDKN